MLAQQDGSSVTIEDGTIVAATPADMVPVFRAALDLQPEITPADGDPDIARTNWLLSHFSHGHVVSVTEEADFTKGVE